jgi:hypothetical protein
LYCPDCPNLFKIGRIPVGIIKRDCFWLNLKENDIVRLQRIIRKYVKHKNIHKRKILLKYLPWELVNMIV